MSTVEEEFHDVEEELKRADHLIYVSLKYTRTCDIFKSIIERLINAIDHMIGAILITLEKEGKIDAIPEQPGLRTKAIKDNIKDEEVLKIIEFYLRLRKLNRAPFERAREFRRHVTMTCKVDGEDIDINIDIMTEDFNNTKEYFQTIKKFIGK